MKRIFAFLFALAFATVAQAQVTNPGVRITGAFAANDCLKIVNRNAVTSTGAACAGATSPGGAASTLQYNNAGAFGGVLGSAVTAGTGAISLTASLTGVTFISVAGSYGMSGGQAGVNNNGVGLYASGLLWWVGSGGFTNTPDVALQRGAAGQLHQYVGTAAQDYWVFNTRTSATIYEAGIFSWQNTANVLSIGTVAAGGGTTRNMQFVVGGASKLDYGITVAGQWYTGANVQFASSTIIGGLGSGTLFNSSALGVILFTDNSTFNTFGRMQLGGTTTAYPSIARNGINVDFKLADDSTYTSAAARAWFVRGAVPTLALAGGTCAGTAIAGGSSAGTVTLTGVCVATNTMALTVMPTAPTGYVCDAIDRTLGASLLVQTATSTTSATFTFGGTTGATDVLAYKCLAY